MTWIEALELVVAATSVRRYRWLCSDGYPGHEKWRAWIIREASGESHPIKVVYAADDAPRTRRGCGAC